MTRVAFTLAEAVLWERSLDAYVVTFATALDARGLTTELIQVPCKFQRPANRMPVVRRPLS